MRTGGVVIKALDAWKTKQGCFYAGRQLSSCKREQPSQTEKA